MPFESLSCPRCGSASIQEVKHETYFCNHCDNVFKYVSPGRPAESTGGCELPEEGRPCGVPAIGHCRTCHRAFCRTHQARAVGGVENLLDSEFGAASAAAFRGYIDRCTACRSAEFEKLDDKDKPALGRPFGEFLEERFFTSESRAGTSVDTSARMAVNDLVARADRALAQYPHDPVLPWVEEIIQLCNGHAVDGSAIEGGERIMRIRRQDGTPFYIYSSWTGTLRAAVFYTNVWIVGGSKMLVAKCTKFEQGSNSRDGGGYRAPLIRYTEVEEVGASRMESIAGSLKRYFPPQPSPEEKAPAQKKAGRRRWFY
jgi:hypothetical protein